MASEGSPDPEHPTHYAMQPEGPELPTARQIRAIKNAAREW